MKPNLVSVLRCAVTEWLAHRASSKGAALAFYTLFSMAPILVLAFLLMLSLVVSAALTLLENLWSAYWREAGPVVSAINFIIGFAVIAALFGVIFKMLPRIRLSWHDVTIGAAGSVIALLLWVYYPAQIFFPGAEFARQYALQLGSLRRRSATQP